MGICRDGVLHPTAEESPFTCYRDCNVPTLANANPNKQVIKHNEYVEMLCSPGYSNPDKYRICRDGVLHPTVEESPFTCYQDCDVPFMWYANPDKEVVKHNETVTYFCDGLYGRSEFYTFKCNDGRIDLGISICTS